MRERDRREGPERRVRGADTRAPFLGIVVGDGQMAHGRISADLIGLGLSKKCSCAGDRDHRHCYGISHLAICAAPMHVLNDREKQKAIAFESIRNTTILRTCSGHIFLSKSGEGLFLARRRLQADGVIRLPRGWPVGRGRLAPLHLNAAYVQSLACWRENGVTPPV